MANTDDWIDIPIHSAEADDWQDIPLEPSFGQKALNALGMAGRAIDKYSGGTAARAGIAAAQDVGSLNPIDWAKAGGKAFLQHLGDDPESVPSGEDIVKKAGVPEGIPSKVAGLGVDIAASPLNLLPYGKPIVKGIEESGKFLGGAVKGSYLGQKTTDVLNATGRGAAKVGEALTGVPKKDITTYATRAPEIKQLMAESGGSIPEAADVIRTRTQNAIRAKKSASNSDISSAIENASPKKTIDLEPVMKELEKVRGRLNPNLEVEDIAQIDKLSARLENVTNSRGKVSPQDIQDVVHFLQKKGQPAFPTGSIFQSASDAQQAAKGGSAAAVELRNEAIPAVKGPFQDLVKMRILNKQMNKNLITPGKSERSLVAAGAGTNERGLKGLQELSDVTGHNAVKDAELLSAADKFSNPSLLPIDATGKSGTRLAVGAGGGSMVAHALGLDPAMGAKIGAALTSPAALKLGIDTTRAVGSVPVAIMTQVRRLSDADFMKLFGVLKTTETESKIARYLSQVKSPQRVPAEDWKDE